MKKISSLLLLAAIFLSTAPSATAQEATPVRTIIFPVIGKVTYWNDFGAPRDGGARSHEGNDLMGTKMLPLVAAVDGRVRVSYPEETWGYSVTITDKDGYTYHYLHVNNDTPGTDDGKGGGMNAYAVDVDDGSIVVAGQLLGWMGDSGNAETTPAHLHFEIRNPDRTPFSPYPSLQAAKKITVPSPRPQQPDEILPFGEFGGGSFIASGNLDGDQAAEIVVGAGPGGGPHVRVLKQDGSEISNFFPYATTFSGGVDVAVGDITGDGISEIITSPFSRGGPHIKVFTLAGIELGGFMAYDPKFTGGVNISTADMDNDGKSEIITSPGKGGGPHIRAFKLDGTEVMAFFAYDTSFRGGADVAGYSYGGQSYIATAPNAGGGPHTKVFNNQGIMQSEFMSYDEGHRGGVRISFGNIDRTSSQPEIITAPLLGGSHIKMFDLQGNTLDHDWGFEEWWSGSWDVTGHEGEVFTAVGPNSRRRASVREANLN